MTAVSRPRHDAHVTSHPFIDRITLPSAVDDRLFFAQVREDPTLEIEALAPSNRDTVVVVGSGGCTALSLVSAGAGRVVAVDLNRTQSHLVELKAAAVAMLSRGHAIGLLGGRPEDGRFRVELYRLLRPRLTLAARDYWDARLDDIASGVITRGVSERFIAHIVRAVRLFVHPSKRIERLLACQSLHEQRELYAREWNSRRWRLMFQLLLNRLVFNKTYDPRFFAGVENSGFPRHFHRLVERALTDIPVQTNYFLHQMLTGYYQTSVEGAVPPYLDRASHSSEIAERLTIVDGSYVDYLRTCPNASVDCFALSNICEWLTPSEIDALFSEVVRTAAPGARLVFRNFVGWTDVPEQWKSRVIEDAARGEALSRRDRSLVQPRIAVCQVVSGAS